MADDLKFNRRARASCNTSRQLIRESLERITRSQDLLGHEGSRELTRRFDRLMGRRRSR